MLIIEARKREKMKERKKEERREEEKGRKKGEREEGQELFSIKVTSEGLKLNVIWGQVEDGWKEGGGEIYHKLKCPAEIYIYHYIILYITKPYWKKVLAN